MKDTQAQLPVAGALARGFCIATLLALPLLMPVQAQAPDAKPVATEAPRDSSPQATSRNIYLAGGNVRPTAPVKGDLYAAGGRVIVEHPVLGDATLAGGAVTVRAPIGDDLRDRKSVV